MLALLVVLKYTVNYTMTKSTGIHAVCTYICAFYNYMLIVTSYSDCI